MVPGEGVKTRAQTQALGDLLDDQRLSSVLTWS